MGGMTGTLNAGAASELRGTLKEKQELNGTLKEKQRLNGRVVSVGEDGGYYTPAFEQLDADTMQVSFAASKEDMPPIEPQNIALLAGYTPQKGIDYQDGKDGASVTVQSVEESTADGGSNVVTFSDGKKLNVKNGSKGSPGHTPVKGVDYVDGASITVQSVSESAADDGNNVVTFSDGKSVTIKNGSKGSAGSKGNDGVSATHSWSGTTLTITSASGTSSANLKGDKGDAGAAGKTPVKGTDYFTSAEIASVATQAASQVTPDGIGAAAASHTHVFSSDITGTVSAGRGGTGRSSLTSGSYLVGNGTSAVTLKKAADVCAHIGAASYEEGTWTPTDVNSCGLTWSSSTMLYTKIGRFVHVLLKFKAASSVKSKAIVIGGLPFEPNCTYPTSLGGWTSADGNGKAAKTGFCVTDAAQGSYYVRLVTYSFADAKDSDIGASRDCTISLYYQVK